MREYSNVIDLEDLDYNPLDSGNYLSLAVQRAKEESDIHERVRIVRDAVATLYCEAAERKEAKIGYICHRSSKIFYAFFKYNGKRYYWLEKCLDDTSFPPVSDKELNYHNNIAGYEYERLFWEWRRSQVNIKSYIYTLEFPIIVDPIFTYVGFSSNPTQEPLVSLNIFPKI